MMMPVEPQPKEAKVCGLALRSESTSALGRGIRKITKGLAGGDGTCQTYKISSRE